MPEIPRTSTNGIQRWHQEQKGGPDYVDCFFGSAVYNWGLRRSVNVGNTERLSFQLYEDDEWFEAYFPPA